MVIVEGEPRIGVQLAPNHVPPDWPDGHRAQQIHLDLWVEDFPSAHDRSWRWVRGPEACRQATSADNFQVYADPAGHLSACAGSSGGETRLMYVPE